MNFWKNIKKPIIGLAPMDGVTDFPMRKIQCEIARLAEDGESRLAKPDVLYTEFISAEGFVRNPKAFGKKLFFEEDQRPIVVQIFGYTPQAFYETILKVSGMKFDGVDINMGCPAKSVLKKGGGCALIENQTLAGEIIESSLKALNKAKFNLPLSIKTRIGSNSNLSKEWFGFLSQFSISEVTVHGRRLKDRNSKDVNWEEIKIAAEILKRKGIICLGNGGVRGVTEASNLCTKYGLDGVLIGQAALGNPWVFKEAYRASKEDILRVIEKHAKYAEEFYDKKGFVTVRKHFGWYPKGFENCTRLKTELMKTNNYNEVKSILDKFREI